MPGLHLNVIIWITPFSFFFSYFCLCFVLSLSVSFLLFYSIHPFRTQLLHPWLPDLTDAWQDSAPAVLVQVRSTQHVVNTLDARPLLLFALKLFNLHGMVLTADVRRAWSACFGKVLLVSDSVEVSLVFWSQLIVWLWQSLRWVLFLACHWGTHILRL